MGVIVKDFRGIPWSIDKRDIQEVFCISKDPELWRVKTIWNTHYIEEDEMTKLFQEIGKK